MPTNQSAVQDCIGGLTENKVINEIHVSCPLKKKHMPLSINHDNSVDLGVLLKGNVFTCVPRQVSVYFLVGLSESPW